MRLAVGESKTDAGSGRTIPLDKFTGTKAHDVESRALRYPDGTERMESH